MHEKIPNHARDADLHRYPAAGEVHWACLWIRRKSGDGGDHFRNVIRISLDLAIERGERAAAVSEIPFGLAANLADHRLYRGAAYPKTSSLRSGSVCLLGEW